MLGKRGKGKQKLHHMHTQATKESKIKSTKLAFPRTNKEPNRGKQKADELNTWTRGTEDKQEESGESNDKHAIVSSKLTTLTLTVVIAVELIFLKAHEMDLTSLISFS